MIQAPALQIIYYFPFCFFLSSSLPFPPSLPPSLRSFLPFFPSSSFFFAWSTDLPQERGMGNKTSWLYVSHETRTHVSKIKCITTYSKNDCNLLFNVIFTLHVITISVESYHCRYSYRQWFLANWSKREVKQSLLIYIVMHSMSYRLTCFFLAGQNSWLKFNTKWKKLLQRKESLKIMAAWREARPGVARSRNTNLCHLTTWMRSHLVSQSLTKITLKTTPEDNFFPEEVFVKFIYLAMDKFQG